MTRGTQSKTVGQLSNTSQSSQRIPAVLTRLTWLLWVGSLVVLAAWIRSESPWELSGVLAVDGLTIIMWVVVPFFGGIVHSYSRRYMAGSHNISGFFTRVFGFVLVVMVLVAADHVALFVATWLAMGLFMAELIGFVRGWRQARIAGAIARRYFLASSVVLAVSLATLWWATDATTISGIVSSVDGIERNVRLFAVGLLILAAVIQSALVPFHTWLLSSMTAPTPASALMHAGFVNAGGILLTRFAPVVALEEVMLVVVVVGAASALLGKLLKSVRTDVKSQLGCSTVGQMGFMTMQAGLGFFGAAITHLVLHGFYKAYLFLASGSRVEQTNPDRRDSTRGSLGIVGAIVTGLTAVVGGGLFAVLTGKGTELDAGLLLTLLVVVTTLHGTQDVVKRTALPATLRYGVVPLVFLPSIALYAGAYEAITGLLHGLPAVTAPAELTIVHGIVAAL